MRLNQLASQLRSHRTYLAYGLVKPKVRKRKMVIVNEEGGYKSSMGVEMLTDGMHIVQTDYLWD